MHKRGKTQVNMPLLLFDHSKTSIFIILLSQEKKNNFQISNLQSIFYYQKINSNSNKYNNKMKDQTFLNNLADFKDVRLASRNQLMDIENRSRDSFQSKGSYCPPQLDIEGQNNDKLLKNFKQLRQQLRQSTKLSQKLKIKCDEKQVELERIRQSERDLITTNHQLKNQLEHLKHSNDDLKAKLQLLKGITKNSQQSEQQIQFLKITINTMKTQMACLEDQRSKLLEISIIQKVELEEKIKRFQAKKGSDIQYVQQMQIQVSKLREKCIKLQNQLKKMQIKYDEEVYTKQWANGNFQKEHLQDQLRQADTENQQLLAKHKKQKQRRNMLQKRVLELEQSTGLWIVKAQTYEVENKALQKKWKQIQKKMELTKQQSNKKLSEVLSLEQKFTKSVTIADELISRVKRQLYGDLVALAKSCQFRLNKLKQEKESFFKNTENQQMRKSVTQTKTRSKSKNLRGQLQKQYDLEGESKPNLVNLKQKFEQCVPKYESEVHRDSVQVSRTETNRSGCALSEIENIEGRIKKQRDEMEKKIREKMLYRKLEVANSPEKHKLREDYFRLFQN